MTGPRRSEMDPGTRRPGFDPRRVASLVRSVVDRTALDLSGAVVVTEAATRAYAVTPVIAAVAGAERVYAKAGGSVERAWRDIGELAAHLGVADRLELVADLSADLVGRADIVTNSGHVRPIDAGLVGWMRPTAVVPLMYEAWELRPGDVDVAACARRGITVAGTNERHPAVAVFEFLGVMAVRLLTDAGVGVYGSRVLLLCDNAFAPFIERGLAGVGAEVDVAPTLVVHGGRSDYDAIVVALQPRREPVLAAREARMIADAWPGAVMMQLWGDLDRVAFTASDIAVWPPAAPTPGHMAMLPSAVGPDPIVRLQSGGLKVGEILWRERRAGRTVTESLATAVASGYGTAL